VLGTDQGIPDLDAIEERVEPLLEDVVSPEFRGLSQFLYTVKQGTRTGGVNNSSIIIEALTLTSIQVKSNDAVDMAYLLPETIGLQVKEETLQMPFSAFIRSRKPQTLLQQSPQHSGAVLVPKPSVPFWPTIITIGLGLS
jgi:hypothetical protein